MKTPFRKGTSSVWFRCELTYKGALHALCNAFRTVMKHFPALCTSAWWDTTRVARYKTRIWPGKFEVYTLKLSWMYINCTRVKPAFIAGKLNLSEWVHLSERLRIEITWRSLYSSSWGWKRNRNSGPLYSARIFLTSPEPRWQCFCRAKAALYIPHPVFTKTFTMSLCTREWTHRICRRRDRHIPSHAFECQHLLRGFDDYIPIRLRFSLKF